METVVVDDGKEGVDAGDCSGTMLKERSSGESKEETDWARARSERRKMRLMNKKKTPISHTTPDEKDSEENDIDSLNVEKTALAEVESKDLPITRTDMSRKNGKKTKTSKRDRIKKIFSEMDISTTPTGWNDLAEASYTSKSLLDSELESKMAKPDEDVASKSKKIQSSGEKKSLTTKQFREKANLHSSSDKNSNDSLRTLKAVRYTSYLSFSELEQKMYTDDVFIGIFKAGFASKQTWSVGVVSAGSRSVELRGEDQINRALDGDVVAVQSETLASGLKVSKVISILQRDMRPVFGKLRFKPKHKHCSFFPKDSIFPKGIIEVPAQLIDSLHSKHHQVSVHYLYWNETDDFPTISILEFESRVELSHQKDNQTLSYEEKDSPLQVVKEKSFGTKKIIKEKTKSMYMEHLTKSEIEKGLVEQRILVGQIRVNGKNPSEAYVTVEGIDRDFKIKGKHNRNRAFHNDTVAIEIVSDQEQSENVDRNSDDEINTDLNTAEMKGELLEDEASKPHRLARVVAIVQSAELPGVVGYLRIGTKGDFENISYVHFIPQDTRLPIGLLYVEHHDRSKSLQGSGIPYSILKNCQDPEKILIEVKFRHWNPQQLNVVCDFIRIIGNVGDLKAEVSALLLRYKITHTDSFSDDVLDCLKHFETGMDKSSKEWAIPDEEINKRLDLRNTRIFTIDPTTAKDLDDALSVTKLPNGRFKIGVHIADVSYFVENGTALDAEAAFRATSVYLMKSVIPMLPRLLCENLCSLNPSVDRLAFSVFWEMTDDGTPLFQTAEFCRSVIRSCIKLDYGTAQKMITNGLTSEDRTILVEKMSMRSDNSSEHSLDDVIADVNLLHHLSKRRREFRYKNGALKLDSIELQYELDDNDSPISVREYERFDSHFLIEEFMLLANEMAARRIANLFPNVALLRRHPPPANKLERMIEICQKFGVQSDLRSAFEIHEAIDATRNIYCNSGKSNFSIADVLEFLFTRRMKAAEYFCISDQPSETWRHFNLNLDYYTHFTSPIRRYADLIVHRMLSESLSAKEKSADFIKKIAKNCNDRSTSCRNLDQDMDVLYFCHLVKKVPISQKCIIVDMGKTAFTVICVPLGIDGMISCDNIRKINGAKSAQIFGEDLSLDRVLKIDWDDGDIQELKLFDEVDVQISMKDSRRVTVDMVLTRRIQRPDSNRKKKVMFKDKARTKALTEEEKMVLEEIEKDMSVSAHNLSEAQAESSAEEVI